MGKKKMKNADIRRVIGQRMKVVLKECDLGHLRNVGKGMEYRQRWNHILRHCFGSTFEEGSWWYRNPDVDRFFACLLNKASNGRVSEDANIQGLFEVGKKGQYFIRKDRLARFGCKLQDLKRLFESTRAADEKSRTVPRGEIAPPLIVQPPQWVDPEDAARIDPPAGSASPGGNTAAEPASSPGSLGAGAVKSEDDEMEDEEYPDTDGEYSSAGEEDEDEDEVARRAGAHTLPSGPGSEGQGRPAGAVGECEGAGTPAHHENRATTVTETPATVFSRPGTCGAAAAKPEAEQEDDGDCGDPVAYAGIPAEEDMPLSQQTVAQGVWEHCSAKGKEACQGEFDMSDIPFLTDPDATPRLEDILGDEVDRQVVRQGIEAMHNDPVQHVDELNVMERHLHALIGQSRILRPEHQQEAKAALTRLTEILWLEQQTAEIEMYAAEMLTSSGGADDHAGSDLGGAIGTG